MAITVMILLLLVANQIIDENTISTQGLDNNSNLSTETNYILTAVYSVNDNARGYINGVLKIDKSGYTGLGTNSIAIGYEAAFTSNTNSGTASYGKVFTGL